MSWAYQNTILFAGCQYHVLPAWVHIPQANQYPASETATSPRFLARLDHPRSTATISDAPKTSHLTHPQQSGLSRPLALARRGPVIQNIASAVAKWRELPPKHAPKPVWAPRR
ncbi:hypothetical protein ONS96_004299 [Cadophora gregata f. sp. sojae]|nr:hypothetical protein ONS96_004299 [Cadophora gregata f. sp. sojae]